MDEAGTMHVSHFDDPDDFSITEEPEEPQYAEPDPNDHINLVAGADVYLVESDFQFFNLGDNPTCKELDKSYRQLAVSLHPDKNGGSKDAKEAFQYLQTRYERLKAQILAGHLSGALK